jgi:deoxyribose-phosphate aldolase
MRRSELAALLDITLLRPDAAAHEVRALCEQAAELGAAAVCVSPTRVKMAHAVLSALPRDVGLATVCGFPSGAHHGSVKAAEAGEALAEGATEVDMVLNLGAVVDEDWAAVEADVTAVQWAVQQARPDAIVKVIVESALLSDEALVRCCQAAEAAGAAFVKTSTGFSPAGGATVHAVEVMAGAVGGRLGIKASGGIGSTADALALVAAGATRLGVSRAAAVLADLPE